MVSISDPAMAFNNEYSYGIMGSKYPHPNDL